MTIDGEIILAGRQTERPRMMPRSGRFPEHSLQVGKQEEKVRNELSSDIRLSLCIRHRENLRGGVEDALSPHL